MEPKLAPLPPLEAPKPPKTTSKKALLSVFAAAFVILLMILNLPAVLRAIAYPFTHSPEANNIQLTEQYRAIYGYEKNPQIMNEIIAATTLPTTSLFPIVPAVAPFASVQAVFKAQLSIPKIGVSAPIQQVADTSEATILGAFKTGTVLYPGSALPGQGGSSVIIGHSSSPPPWTKYSAIFSLLDKLQANDLIYVTVNGTQYTYRVQSIKKGSAQQLIDSGLTGDLVLATCWPVGTDTNRIAVSASLVR